MPREVASLMWGGSAGKIGWKTAEQWAANVEREVFLREKMAKEDRDTDLSSGVGSKATTNEYVRIGALGAIGAKGDVKAASLEGGVAVNVGSHYDARSIDAGKARRYRGGHIGAPMPQLDRGQLVFLGTSFLTVDTSFGVSAGILGGGASLSLELMGRQHMKEAGEGGNRKQKRMKWVPEGYLSGTGSFSVSPVPLPAGLLPLLADSIKKLALPLYDNMTGVAKKAERDKRTKDQFSADALDAGGNGLLSAFQSINPADLGAGGLASLAAGALPMPTKLMVDLNVGYQFGETAKKGVTIDLQVSQESGIEFDAGLLGMQLTKGSRLLRVIWSGGKWMPKID